MIEAKFKANLQNFFKFYVSLLNPLLKLTKREQEVLSVLLLIYYTNLSNPQVDTLIFSQPIKRQIRAHLNLSEPSLNNSMTILRKKEVIKDNKINRNLLKFPEDNKININYTIELI